MQNEQFISFANQKLNSSMLRREMWDYSPVKKKTNPEKLNMERVDTLNYFPLPQDIHRNRATTTTNARVFAAN